MQRLVAKTAHALVFPEDGLDYIDDKLLFQREHHMSFFSTLIGHLDTRPGSFTIMSSG